MERWTNLEMNTEELKGMKSNSSFRMIKEVVSRKIFY